ncbi:MAG: WS/DGAT/MGAT family O-acyltransferase [Actinomycetota bacterium]
MQYLTGLDAAFLALESPTAPMQVMGIAILDPATVPEPDDGPFYERVRELMGARLHLVPPLRRRVVEVPFGLYVPAWVDDPDFDLDYHLRRAALPAPGGEAELDAFIAEVASRPLDRSRPLWEAYVVEGLAGGRQAFVAKLHHSMIDGLAGVAILAALFDLAPDTPYRPERGPDAWIPERVPGDAEMLGRAIVSIAENPARVMRALVSSVSGVIRAVRRARDEALDVALPLTAPRLAMNRSISARRTVAFSSLSLADVKAVKQAHGVTVNDVVLATLAGALRRYLGFREELPERALVAAIPTSVRTGDHDAFGNQVSSMFASLPVEIADPADRLQAVARSMSGAKGVHEEVGPFTLQEWAATAAPVVFSRAMRAYTRLRIGERIRPLINLVASNVPGPPWPLYFAGARLEELHPLGPVFDDCGLNVTVISYLDRVDFGFIACRELVPDVDALARFVPAAFAELRDAPPTA